MNESRVSEKELDFSILLSTYLLNEDYSTVREKVTRLAEFGQVNAMQYFYLMKPEFEINEKIDKNLKLLLSDESFERDIALRNYLLAKEKTDKFFPDQYKGIGKTENTIPELEKSCFKKIKEQLAEKNKPTLFVRYLELKILLKKKLTQVDQQNLKKVQKVLLNKYNENPKDINISFALGKLLVLFNDDESLQLLGKQILSEISNRKLLKCLEEETIKEPVFLKNSNNEKKKNVSEAKEKPSQKKKTNILE